MTPIGPASLAPYAATEADSPGRRIAEPPPTHRSEFQRDRDRVIHSTAFRRLVYKTQVFVNHEGDLYRTRLTHSLEVAQIARTVAGALDINEYLVEAICLAHDLGHTPFGHAGQDALNACMAEHGGFEHNFQSLRVVDDLEEKYAEFAGLNLMFETREGILKHCSRRRARELGELGRRFLEGRSPTLEAQLANLADEIAYNSHDVDDGLRAGLLDLDDLRGVAIIGKAFEAVARRYPGLSGRRQIYEIVRRLIGYLVDDLVEETGRRLVAAAPPDVEAVRAHGTPLAGFSDAVGGAHAELKRYLMKNLYRHPRVVGMTRRATRTVTRLFAVYAQDASLMSQDFAQAAGRAADRGDESARLRVVADYIAGMTDRFALQEYRRLIDAG